MVDIYSAGRGLSHTQANGPFMVFQKLVRPPHALGVKEHNGNCYFYLMYVVQVFAANEIDWMNFLASTVRCIILSMTVKDMVLLCAVIELIFALLDSNRYRLVLLIENYG